jgi:hypothetical protein
MTFAVCPSCIRVAPEWADSSGNVLRTTCVRCGSKLVTMEKVDRPTPTPASSAAPATIGEPPHTIVRLDNIGPSDAVNPAYYKGREVMDIINHFKLSFCVGTVVCYLLRHKEKNGVEDLKKAVWYLKEEIRILEGGKEG